MLARALKTHANSNQYAKFCLKPMRIATNASEPRPAAGGAAVNVAVRASSVEKHISHALTQLRLARSHARTTRTRNETETDFPVGVSCRFFPHNLRSFEITCRGQMLRLSVVIHCGYYRLRAAVDMICCDYLLRAAVAS